MTEEKTAEPPASPLPADPRITEIARRIDRLLDEDPRRAAEAFDALTLDEQLQVLLQEKAMGRLELITLSRRARELVQALPPGELYLTVKEIGEADALPLLGLISPRQMQFFLDVEGWREDRLDITRAQRTLALFHSGAPDQVAVWMRHAEPEDLAAILKASLRVVVPDLDIDPMEAADLLPPFTLDGVRFIQFRDDNLGRVLQDALLRLHSDDPQFVRNVLDGVTWEVQGELEEQARERRESRLAELGMPPLEEAQAIYR